MIRISLLLGFLVTQAPSQSALDELHPALRPFRRPDRNIEPPRELFELLRTMQQIAKAHGASFDAEGRETCDDDAWRHARDAMQIKIEKQAGYLKVLIEESASAEDRATAAFGSLYVESPQDAFGLITRFPGEPAHQIREAAFHHAIAFIRAQWSKSQGKLGPNGKAPPLYELNLLPYAALLRQKDPIDQAQGCWFLRECLVVRPELAKELLEIVGPLLRPLLVSDEKVARKEARELLNTIDKLRRAPKSDKNEDVLAWLDTVTEELFPQIRQICEGIIEIWPGKVRDRLIATGKDALERDAIGAPFNGDLKSGVHYRGFRVARLPEPLDELRLPLEAVITSVNGTPIATSAELLETVRALLARGSHQLLIEYVHKTEQRVLEYRIRT